ncbi:hypersensitive response-inducing protein [Biscogniauxia mediterranea]|nr:hypersensitive response-inducing protein [Biscogniauxia mediterranea]
MKYSVVAAFAATAAAAAIGKRDDVFAVSDFSAGCIPHSTQCLYSFGVLQKGTMETTPVSCKAMVPANTDGTLPEVKDAACTDSSRTFSVTRSADGLTLTVTQPITPSSNQSGSHLIPADQLAMSNAPNANVQSYTGPTSFNLQG